MMDKQMEEKLARILRDFNASNIMSYHSGQLLNAEYIICSVNSINHSMKDRNPLDMVKFFHKSLDHAHHIPASDASYMMTSTFQEKTLR